jgi:hypothetical protein
MPSGVRLAEGREGSRVPVSVLQAHADFKAAVEGIVGKEVAEKFLLGRDLVNELDKQVGKLPWPPPSR